MVFVKEADSPEVSLCLLLRSNTIPQFESPSRLQPTGLPLQRQ